MPPRPWTAADADDGTPADAPVTRSVGTDDHVQLTPQRRPPLASSDRRPPRTSSATTVVLALALAFALLAVLERPAHASFDATAEQHFVDLINHERTSRGLPALSVATDVRAVARDWSAQMAATGNFVHNPDFVAQVGGEDAYENIAVRWSTSLSRDAKIEWIHNNLMNSPTHRANILEPDVTEVGVGAWYGDIDGVPYLYVTQNFRRPAGTTTDPEPDPEPVPQPPPAEGGGSDSARPPAAQPRRAPELPQLHPQTQPAIEPAVAPAHRAIRPPRPTPHEIGLYTSWQLLIDIADTFVRITDRPPASAADMARALLGEVLGIGADAGADGP